MPGVNTEWCGVCGHYVFADPDAQSRNTFIHRKHANDVVTQSVMTKEHESMYTICYIRPSDGKYVIKGPFESRELAQAYIDVSSFRPHHGVQVVSTWEPFGRQVDRARRSLNPPKNVYGFQRKPNQNTLSCYAQVRNVPRIEIEATNLVDARCGLERIVGSGRCNEWVNTGSSAA